MKFSTWYKYHKNRGEYKYYYPECEGIAPSQIHKDKSYASYNDETKVFYLQFFLRNQPTVEFRLRKQVQHILKRHFGCMGTILLTNQQKETKKETTFVKLEFYAICNLPTNEMMDKVGEVIKKTIEK